MSDDCTETYKECTAARRARVERVIAEADAWDTTQDLAAKAGVGHATIERVKRLLQSPSLEAVCNSAEPDPDAPPAGHYLPITNEEIRAVHEAAGKEVRDWIAAYALLKPKQRKDAYSLFINLTAIGDL